MGVFDIKTFSYEVKNGAICVTHENAKYINEENIVSNTGISLNLLKLILEKEDVFNYTVLVFSGNLKNFQILQNPSSDYALRCYKTKKRIYSAFVEALKLGVLELDDTTRGRLKLLKEMSDISYYEQAKKEEVYELNIEGNDYKFSIKDFFSLLKKDHLELSNMLEKEELINGIKKEYYLYALKRYFTSNYLKNNYNFDQVMKKNLEIINYDTYVDTFAINVKFESDKLLDEVVINPELEAYIMNGVKESFSTLEKCIYIYLKLCKILTYDEEFYAVHQEGKTAEKHRNIEYISHISLTNNSVVCFEFSKIFAYFLKKLGITSKSDGQRLYGYGHDNVEFRCGKFIILADALTSIFTGDLFRIKLNQEPIGLLCFNKNKNSQKEFGKTVKKVLEYVKNEDAFEYQEALSAYSIDDLLAQYHKLTDNYKEIPIEERVDILLEKVNSIKSLKGIDMYSYVMSLGKICFSEEERKENITFEIVKNNQSNEEGKDAMPIGILVLNVSGFAQNAYENNYYTYSPHEGIKQISYYVLKEYFDKSIYEAIDSNRGLTIPGICGGKTL